VLSDITHSLRSRSVAIGDHQYRKVTTSVDQFNPTGHRVIPGHGSVNVRHRR
jgi:hypothetical protein